MENLLYCLNATMPIFFMMMLGCFLHQIGFLTGSFSSQLNRFVFDVALPVLVFEDLAAQDFAAVWDTKFVLFCFGVTLLCICLIALISGVLLKEKSKRGEFIQAAYRSSAAILGIAFINSLYGEGASPMGPLMILSSVPLYNVAAVVVLTLTAPQKEGALTDKKTLGRKTIKGIVTNPILIGIVLGAAWSVLGIPQPTIFLAVVEDVGALATPLGLIAMGASLEFGKIRQNLRPALLAAFIKLIGLVALFLPLAIALGFLQEQLIAILVMLGSATTVSCYVMAKNMGHEGDLTASTVMLTTIGCSFTLTFWLYILKTMEFI